MLKTISFINIAVAILYFWLYLLNSTSYAMLGIFVTIAFSTLVIIKTEKELKFKTIDYVLSLPGLVFAGFLSVWVFNVISSSLEHNYFNNSWFYILISTCLVASILVQFINIFIRRL
nr:hypothetical protein [Pedobacter panaciterrae]